MFKATALLFVPFLAAAEWWEDEFQNPVDCGGCAFDVSESGELTVEEGCTVAAQCRNLSVRYKGITSVPADIFQGHGMELTVRRISLTNNAITQLSGGLFDGLTLMHSLVMRQNRITSLPADLLDGVPALELFQFGTNFIREVPADIFDGHTSLLTVDFGSNYLKTLPAGLLTGLEKLQIANFAYNRIASVPADLFADTGDLTNVNLDRNKLTSLPEGLFNGLSRTIIVDLRNNQLSELPANLFQGTPELRTLRLDNNMLTTLPPGLLDACTNLWELQLTGNFLSSIPHGVFETVPSLNWLDISDNQLTELPVKMFDTQTWGGVLMDSNPLTCKVDFDADVKEVPSDYDSLDDCVTACVEFNHGTRSPDGSQNADIIKIDGKNFIIKETAEECNEFCWNTADCEIFTYRVAGKKCQVKKIGSKFGGFFPKTGRTTGYVQDPANYDDTDCADL